MPQLDTDAAGPRLETPFTRAVGIDVPIVCGAMYPCSNAELVAAVSEAGGIGVIQPLSLIYVFGYDLRAGIRKIRELTSRPIGFNAIIERSAKAYEDRMRKWIDVALEEGIRFFVTALGDPGWVVDKVHAVGGIVYHDVTERRFAERAIQRGVDGLICVNARAGGHAGPKTPEALIAELGDLGVPLVCAGGIGDPADFRHALDLGYAGVQMGTRFIATDECTVHDDYKQAILRAKADDVILTERISGVPCAVIKTPSVEHLGTKAGPLARFLLRNRRTKHLMRGFYSLRSIWQLKRSSLRGVSYKDFFQAGKSVEGIDRVEPAGEIVRSFAAAAVA